MPRPVSRKRAAARAKQPAFTFQTKKLRGIQVETPAQKKEAERLKAEWLEKNPVRRT